MFSTTGGADLSLSPERRVSRIERVGYTPT
jgi:hypothetical protein